jgi:hypothetical protein
MARVLRKISSYGYFSDPRKSICSTKWAIPWNSIGSAIEPVPTLSEAALISVLLDVI